MMYYASRTLPNFFAFGFGESLSLSLSLFHLGLSHSRVLVTLAARNILPQAGRRPSSRPARSRHKIALGLLTATGMVFRSELAILLACYTMYLFLHPHIRFPIISIISSGILGALIALLTIPIDTFFWRSPTPLWPELTAFTYNVINSNSSNWGTSPWHFYFTSALPRLLSNPFLQLCIPFTLSIPILRRPALDVLVPNLLFVTIYSFQPHKEWRFIIYVVPPLIAVASAGASWIWTRRSKTFTYRVLAIALVASTIASFAASAGMLAVSRLNYPGAQALNRLHKLTETDTGTVKVHMDTLACMTGVTRFLERKTSALEDGDGAFWLYDKTEDKETLLDPAFWQGFDYSLAEEPEKALGEWIILDTIDGFAGVGTFRLNEDVEAVSDDPIDGHAFWEMMKKVLRERKWKFEDRNDLKQFLAYGWSRGEMLLRRHVTRGWWVKMNMEPRIRILKRMEAPSVNDAFVDEALSEASSSEPLDTK